MSSLSSAYTDSLCSGDIVEPTFIHSETFMAYLDTTAAKCGYTDYFEKYVTFPPQGLLPLPGHDVNGDPGCLLWEEIFNATLLVNPAFNVYRIFDTVSGAGPCGVNAR